ncbi:MAG TPA: hypothetical protein VLB27_02570 [candidate division Zixibacteria bacterium]|nr:hypothetical protein [candidate division Zixibacteria bacterium]
MGALTRFAAACLVTCGLTAPVVAEVGASLRTVLGLSDYTPGVFEFTATERFAESLLRATVERTLSTDVTFEAHLVQAVALFESSAVDPGGAETSLLSGGARLRALDLDWSQSHTGTAAADLWLDRLNTRISLGPIDATVGRQAITFGQAYFWNPLDVFLSFDPRQFDRDYKPGVDALRGDLTLGDFSELTLVLAAGGYHDSARGRANDFWSASWYGSVALARWRTTLGDWDAALQAGAVFGGAQCGVGFSGEIGPLESRFEAAYLWADRSIALPGFAEQPLTEDHLTLVAGIGRWLTPTLNVEAEYLFNGAGAGNATELPTAWIRYLNGTLLQVSERVIGEVITYQLTPLSVVSLAGVHSLSDGSGLLQPGVTLSVANEMDLLLGAIVNWGRGADGGVVRSEFGSRPDTYYLEAKIYF